MLFELLHNDTTEALKTVNDGSIDLIFADPPFNVGIDYGPSSKDNRQDYDEWCYDWIKECLRVLKESGTMYLMTITRHLPAMYRIFTQLDGHFINQVNWKNVAATNSRQSFWNSYNPILVYGKTNSYIFNTYAQTQTNQLVRWSGSRKNKGQLTDFWTDIKPVYAGSITHPQAILQPGTNRKAHPCQMPVELPERAILFSSNKGHTVLDPFMGSGSTGIAALKNGRRFIGVDAESKYIEMTRVRLSNFLGQFEPTAQDKAGNQLSLFF